MNDRNPDRKPDDQHPLDRALAFMSDSRLTAALAVFNAAINLAYLLRLGSGALQAWGVAIMAVILIMVLICLRQQTPGRNQRDFSPWTLAINGLLCFAILAYLHANFG